MRALTRWPIAARRAIVGVLTDIDDTLTTDGTITPDALEALATLRAAGYPVFAVTGRPVGWSEPFVRSWPIDAIVAENGAVALDLDPADGALRKRYVASADRRRSDRRRLDAVLARILSDVPTARAARDSVGRETDIAIDHSEFNTMPPADIDRAVGLMRAHGLTASVSSIHINGWLGSHDKFSGAAWIVRERLGRNLADEIERWVYVGDSANDAIPFARIPNSIGVANVRRFSGTLESLPRYVTTGDRGAGFAEVVFALITSRISRSPK